MNKIIYDSTQYIYIYIYILGWVINNFRFLKASANNEFRTSYVLNTTGNYLIKEYRHGSFLFS